MIYHSIIIEIPSGIKKELARVCTGLPSAQWNEQENLYIPIFSFTKQTDENYWDLIDRLGEIQINPFFLKIQRLHYTPRKGFSGLIWAFFESLDNLEKLKKKIETQIKRPHFTQEEKSYPSLKIPLGYVQKESSERLAQYLETNGEFTSSPFEIRQFSLASIHQTSKRLYYVVEKSYPL